MVLLIKIYEKKNYDSVKLFLFFVNVKFFLLNMN
jgi:hypothetical protein